MEWLKKKWKAVTGVIAGLFLGIAAAFAMMLKSRKQKEVLENANKAHEKETKVNLDAMKDLGSGLEKISDDKVDVLKEIDEKFEKDLDEAKKDAKSSAHAAKKDGTLAKKLADAIGADFVEDND